MTETHHAPPERDIDTWTRKNHDALVFLLPPVLVADAKEAHKAGLDFCKTAKHEHLLARFLARPHQLRMRVAVILLNAPLDPTETGA